MYFNEPDAGDDLWFLQLVFFDFTLSELLPIFLWSFFKEPEDCFRDYICQGSEHFSIFQMKEEGFA